MIQNQIDSIKQPEYIGMNRCMPCTLLNLTIAIVMGIILSEVWFIGGVIFLTISLGLIYLRGYLIPKTPELTQRYLPSAVLKWFGKQPDPNTSYGLNEPATTQREDGEPKVGGENDEVDGYLLHNRILKPCEDIDDVCLDSTFEKAWQYEIESFPADTVSATDTIETFDINTSVNRVELVYRSESYILKSGSKKIGSWPSKSALILDIAANRVLSSWDDNWDEYETYQKGRILNSLRLFAKKCPDGSKTDTAEEVIESCCTSYEEITIWCKNTEDIIFKHRFNS